MEDQKKDQNRTIVRKFWPENAGPLISEVQKVEGGGPVNGGTDLQRSQKVENGRPGLAVVSGYTRSTQLNYLVMHFPF